MYYKNRGCLSPSVGKVMKPSESSENYSPLNFKQDDPDS